MDPLRKPEEALDDCRSCDGTGAFDIGDCEEGIVEVCKECQGTGKVDYSLDEFIPARDAFKPGD